MRSFLCLALLLAAVAPAAAQQAPMPSGETQRAPRQHVVAEAGDQIRARDALGAEVRGADGATLGKIEDLYLSRDRGAVDLAVVDGAPLAWASLRFEGRPAPHFIAEEAKRDLANAPKVESDRYVDARALLGADVLGPDGATVGTLSDLVLRFEGGAPAALLVTPQRGASKENLPHVVSWNEAKPQLENKRLRIALDTEALRARPQFATMAPDPTSGADTSGTSAPTPPGTPLGTGAADPSVPAPATRRR
ncbi:MAG: PRC-barrel domain-containing protein [Rhodospirillales bacterium]|nr:PRC-barrel domain-containing protein [Rhodospirillales bacterium]